MPVGIAQAAAGNSAFDGEDQSLPSPRLYSYLYWEKLSNQVNGDFEGRRIAGGK